MFKIMYLPEAICVWGSTEYVKPVTPIFYKTREKALKSLQKNNIYKVTFVSIDPNGGLVMYRKPLGWPWESLPKHLFEVVEV